MSVTVSLFMCEDCKSDRLCSTLRAVLSSCELNLFLCAFNSAALKVLGRTLLEILVCLYKSLVPPTTVLSKREGGVRIDIR